MILKSEHVNQKEAESEDISRILRKFILKSTVLTNSAGPVKATEICIKFR